MKKLKTLIWYLCFACLLAPTFSFAVIYKCKVDGKTLFTDRPCAQGTEQKLNHKLPEQSPIPTNWLSGYYGYEQALELSRRYNAPILIYFKADWCRYCKKLEADLLNTASGREALNDVIKVRVKPESSKANDDFFKRLGGSGYPTIAIQRAFDATPRKHYLMTRETGVWTTKGAEYLENLF